MQDDCWMHVSLHPRAFFLFKTHRKKYVWVPLRDKTVVETNPITTSLWGNISKGHSTQGKHCSEKCRIPILNRNGLSRFFPHFKCYFDLTLWKITPLLVVILWVANISIKIMMSIFQTGMIGLLWLLNCGWKEVNVKKCQVSLTFFLFNKEKLWSQPVSFTDREIQLVLNACKNIHKFIL